MELTPQEKEFMDYWETKRETKKGFRIFLLIGFRNGLIFTSLIMLSITTGWYKRIQLFSLGEFIVLIFSLFLIMTFISFFSAFEKRDCMEQRYLELKHKESI